MLGNYKGNLIVFEGIDGCGKTTQWKYLKEYLEERDYPVLFLKEPRRDSEYGEELYRLLRSGERGSVSREYELFQGDRRGNVSENIIPALELGKIVVLDRYYFSTMAYQGARGMDIGVIERDNLVFAPVPDIVFIFDVDVVTASSRVSQRLSGRSVFEASDYLSRVKAIYDGMDYNFIHRIDGLMSEKEVFIELVELLDEGILSRYV